VTFERYFEPFAGSACLFFALRPAQATLSDLNGELIETYVTVRSHPRRVARAAGAWPVREDVYYDVRALEAAALDPVCRAARFVYLNRHCFNGVYRTDRRNRFNVPFGRRTGDTPKEQRFYRCSVALRTARLRTCDFEEACDDARRGDFVYLDPPYSRAARDAYGVYGYGGFHSSDLARMEELLRRLDRRGVRFMFSYTPTVEVLAATCGWRRSEVAVAAQVGGRARSRSVRGELLVTNYET